MNNKRKNKRKKIEFNIKYFTGHEFSTLYNVSFVKNISSGGFCLKANQLLQIGSNIQIKLLLSDSNQIIDVKAGVIWVKEKYKNKQYEIGIKFLNVNPDTIKRIEESYDL